MNYSSNFKVASLAIFLSIALLGTQAHAALPAGVGAFFTGLTADFNELLGDYFYPLLLTITGGFIVMSLLKKGAKKAT